MNCLKKFSTLALFVSISLGVAKIYALESKNKKTNVKIQLSVGKKVSFLFPNCSADFVNGLMSGGGSSDSSLDFKDIQKLHAAKNSKSSQMDCKKQFVEFAQALAFSSEKDINQKFKVSISPKDKTEFMRAALQKPKLKKISNAKLAHNILTSFGVYEKWHWQKSGDKKNQTKSNTEAGCLGKGCSLLQDVSTSQGTKFSWQQLNRIASAGKKNLTNQNKYGLGPKIPRDEAKNVYSVEISKKLGEGFFGKLKSISVELGTDNDNLFHGGGRVLGIKEKSPFEGNDIGKTFAIDLSTVAQFENASISVEGFSEIYSGFISPPPSNHPKPVDSTAFKKQGGLSKDTRTNSDSSARSKNGNLRSTNGQNYGKPNSPERLVSDIANAVAKPPATSKPPPNAKNTTYEGIRVKLRKNLAGQFFVDFEVEAGRETSKNGIAMHIQDKFHQLANETNACGKQRCITYNYSRKEKNHKLWNGAIGVGKKFTLYKSRSLRIEDTARVGYKFSNSDIHRGGQVENELAFKTKRNTVAIFGKMNTRGHHKYGANWDFTFLQGKTYAVGGRLGVYKEKNAYTKNYPDLPESQKGDDSEELIYTYKLRFTKKF